MLASTSLAEHQLAGAVSSEAEPWELDVAGVVARVDLAFLLEQHCIARARFSDSGALYLTPIEARLARALSEAQVRHDVQVQIGDHRVDFLIDGRLAVECDGAAYHDPESDRSRDRALAAMGVRVLRLSGSEIYRNVAGCITQISNALAGSSANYDVHAVMALSRSQEVATRHRSGPAWVAAPAGSGKTRVIEARIRRLLTQGVDPSRICAISFTNRAVGEMKDRLPKAEAAGVRFSTLHSLAKEISELRPHGRKRVLIQKVRPSPRAPTRWSILKPLLEPGEYKFRRSNILWPEAIGTFRSSHVLPSFESFPPDLRPAPERFLEIHARYDAELEENTLTDFEGYVLNAVRLLSRHPTSRALLSGRYDHWIVDEYQDLPPGKLALLRLLASPARNNLCCRR